MDTLNADVNFSKREAKTRHRTLARKYHPEKSAINFNFGDKMGEYIFKNVSNAYEEAR